MQLTVYMHIETMVTCIFILLQTCASDTYSYVWSSSVLFGLLLVGCPCSSKIVHYKKNKFKSRIVLFVLVHFISQSMKQE